MDGSTFLTKVDQAFPDIVKLMISGYSDFQAASDAINYGGVHKFLPKPWDVDELRNEIKEAFELQFLRKKNSELCALFHQSTQATLLCDEEFKITRVNKAFTKTTEIGSNDIVHKSFVSILSEEHIKQFGAIKESLNEHYEWAGELNLRLNSVLTLPVDVVISTIKSEEFKPYYAIQLFDISERKKTDASAQHQALHDELTDLPNRRLFFKQLDLNLRQYQRSNSKVGLLFLDLDGFKSVNDTVGHDIGDLVLREAALRLKEPLRDSDLIARLGGDEFVVMLPEISQITDCVSVAEKLIQCFQTPISAMGNYFCIGLSAGIITSATTQCPSSLVKRADQAMYKAKAKGGNRYYIWHEGIDHK